MKEAILGSYDTSVWLGTIFWTLILFFMYKLYKSPNKESGFKWNLFIRNNSIDFMLHILLAMVFLRAGKGFINSVYAFINKKIEANFDVVVVLDPESMDIVILVAIIVLPVSYYIHKYLRPKIKTP